MALTLEASEYLAAYTKTYPNMVDLSSTAAVFVESCLQDHDYYLHAVTGRAKTPESLRAKTLQKGYDDPATAITDVIGVRVITYYGEEVNHIAERIREHMTVDASHSLDEREILIQERKFGYRSVHIVGKPSLRSARKVPSLKGITFEIQIRSLLDHVWAEIEHEIVYKSGIAFPEATRRRFSAIAGSFEILEEELLRLRADTDLTVNAHVSEIGANKGKGKVFDTARLLAALEVEQPLAKGWRQAEKAGAPFTTPIRTVHKALGEVGIVNYSNMKAVMRRQGFMSKKESYCSLAACAPDEVSHLALAALLVGYMDPSVLYLYLPDVASSPGMAELFPEA